jgi:tetratricopeptide (TPR) repeat protein
MKLSIPLKDIMIAPGKRFDPAEYTGQDVITRIKKLYGVIAEVMDIATPEKYAEAMKKLAKGVDEAGKGRLPEALKLFQEVLAVIPENVAARRNMAKVYLQQGKLEKAKQHLQECLQIDPKDAWSYVMLGNIYVNNEGNLNVAAFYYEKCLEHHPEDAMVLTNYAGLMT